MNAPSEMKSVGELDRRTYLGSSDAAAVMGLGATYDGIQQTPYTVWFKKTAEEREEMDPDKRRFLDRRKRWEGPIREMLSEEFDAEIVTFNQRYTDQQHPFMAAEIDFEWRDPSDGSIQNGEIKTVHPMAFGERQGWGDPGTSDVPVQYAAQVMFGLMVTGRQRAVLAALVGLDNILFYPIERNEETIAVMRAECLRFWNEHVTTKIPPSPQTVFDLKQFMNRARGRPVQLDLAHKDKLLRLETVRDQLSTLSDEDEQLVFELGDFVCKEWNSPNPYVPPVIAKKAKQKTIAPDVLENAGLYFDGIRIGSWNKQRGAYLDQKRLKIEKPEISREFTKEHIFRVLRFPKAKS